jgi:pseudouridine synthase
LTEGLLILTNDGEAAHRLLHPSYRMPRRYLVEVPGTVGPAVVRRLEKGVELEDGVARPEDVQVTRTARGGRDAATEIHLTLREGRKREIRRLMEALGLPVRRLVRLSFGAVELGELRPGGWRELSAEEIDRLRMAVGLGRIHGDT